MLNSQTKKTKKVAKLFNEISSDYDRINTILSLGQDKRWRRKMIPLLPQKKIRLLDLACGSLEQMITVAEKRPDISFSGIDISEKLINIGKKKIESKKIILEKLTVGSALDLPFEDDSFEAVTVSFGIRNMEDFDKALDEGYRVLKKSGQMFVLEFSLPESLLFRKLSLFYLKHILPKIGNLLSNHSYAYTYLNETIQEFPSGDSFVKHMKRAKFDHVKKFPMTFGVVTLYVGEK